MDNLTPRTPDLNSRIPLPEQGSNFDAEQKKVASVESESQYETIDDTVGSEKTKSESPVIQDNIKPTLEAIRRQPDNQTGKLSGELPLTLQRNTLENILNGHSFDLEPFEVNNMLINSEESPSENN